MRFNELEYIQLNHLQHYMFCKRQWWLLDYHDVWRENYHTALGQILHQKVNKSDLKEKRKGIIIDRAMPVISHKYGVYGILDAVEFEKSKTGIKLKNRKGRDSYTINTIEYKKGKPKKDNSDLIQVIGQVVCLEEMFDTVIDKAYIYYKSTHRRMEYEIGIEERELLKNTLIEMRDYLEKEEIPDFEYSRKCEACSIKEICMPKVRTTKRKVNKYLKKYTGLEYEKT